MAKNKSKATAGSASAAKKAPTPAAKPNSKRFWIFGAAAALLVVGLIIVQGGARGAGGTLKPTAEEAKYIGRYLPQGYVEPKIGDGGKVTADTQMAPITAKQTDSSVSIPVSEVTSKKVVGFTYQKAGAQPIALIAYMKPSGKVAVAVSYCVPCRGTSHTLTTDGALTCDACGTKRDVETGVGISGACKLYPLDEMPVTVEGDQITIQNSVLDGWTQQPGDRKVG